MKKITVKNIVLRKKKSQKITALSCYDYPFARIMDDAGVDIVLIGDSVGMVLRGESNTRKVTMEEMLYHTRMVARAVKRSLVVGDMPYRSFLDPKTAVKNGKLFLKAGADAIKLEGGKTVVKQVEALVRAKVPVMGHVGMTPQKAKSISDFKVQGRTPSSEKKIIADAIALDQAGVFAIVVECVPASLAKKITSAVNCPTIGIGAGKYVDGQIMVTYDMLGFQSNVAPKFVRQYVDTAGVMKKGIARYIKDVSNSNFPSAKESF